MVQGARTLALQPEPAAEPLPASRSHSELAFSWATRYGWILSLSSQLVVSDSLQPHGLQHTRLPCPSLTPAVCSNSHPLSQGCYPTISSSVAPFSSCPQSFLESGSFPMSRLFISDGQSTGASASASVLLMNILVWFPLGLTDLISWQSKSLSRVFSSTTVWKLQFFSVQYSSWSNSHIHLTIVYRTNWRGFRSEAERWRKRSLQLSGELQEAWTMADHREMDGCENDLEVEWTEPSDVRDSGWEKGRRHERPGFWPKWLELGSVCLHRDDTEEEECGLESQTCAGISQLYLPSSVILYKSSIFSGPDYPYL